MSSHGGQGGRSLWGLFYKHLTLINEGSAFMTQLLPTFKYHHTGALVSTCEFFGGGGTNIHLYIVLRLTTSQSHHR